ncbi:MAG: hypothetical protein K2K96_04005 [Lachnospiraceae bacterium]|nr:hypothetical protein [Lachnospiraceae bacterium]
MKHDKHFLKALILIIVFAFGMPQHVRAATSASFDINYIPGAPASVSNQSYAVCLDYYSGGYYVDCTIYGGALIITSSPPGNMEPIIIETTGRTEICRLKGSTTGTVCFKFSAMGNYPCRATGTIHINR